MRIEEPSPLYVDYPIELVPMLHWEHLAPGQRRARVAAMLRNDEEKTRARHQREGTRPLGVRAILATKPFSAPASPKKSPAPLCHAGSKLERKAFRAAYRRYVEAVRAAGKLDQVAIIGTDAIPAALAAVEAGDLEGTVAQFPAEEARIATSLAILALRGNPVDGFIPSPIELITAENVGDVMAPAEATPAA